MSGTVLASHNQPLKTWIVFMYFMGLNLSTRQIAQELNLNGIVNLLECKDGSEEIAPPMGAMKRKSSGDY